MTRQPIHLVASVPLAEFARINAACKAADPNGSDAIPRATHAAEGAKNATHAVLDVRLPEWRAKRLLAKLGTDYGFTKPAATKSDFDSKAKAKIEASGCKVLLAGKGDAGVKSADVVGALKPVESKLD